MVRLSVLLLVLVLSGCAASSAPHDALWQRLDRQTDSGPTGTWFASHTTTRHMRCFPFYCAHS